MATVKYGNGKRVEIPEGELVFVVGSGKSKRVFGLFVGAEDDAGRESRITLEYPI